MKLHRIDFGQGADSPWKTTLETVNGVIMSTSVKRRHQNQSNWRVNLRGQLPLLRLNLYKTMYFIHMSIVNTQNKTKCVVNDIAMSRVCRMFEQMKL